MKNIKLVICDIDNTILPYGHDDISIKLQSAFKILKKKKKNKTINCYRKTL